MNLIYEPHILTLCWTFLIGYVFLTMVIMKKPCEGAQPAIVFYVALPMITLVLIAGLPFAYYKTIEGLWRDQLKRNRLQVKRR